METISRDEMNDLKGTVEDMSVMLNAANAAIKALLRNSPESVAMLTRYLTSTMDGSNVVPLSQQEIEMFCRQIQGLLPPT
jgi:hypothetical protein